MQMILYFKYFDYQSIFIFLSFIFNDNIDMFFVFLAILFSSPYYRYPKNNRPKQTLFSAFYYIVFDMLFKIVAMTGFSDLIFTHFQAIFTLFTLVVNSLIIEPYLQNPCSYWFFSFPSLPLLSLNYIIIPCMLYFFTFSIDFFSI